MKNQTIVFAVVCTICFLFYRCNATSGTSANSDSASTTKEMYAGYSSQTEWGHHLVAVGGCSDCHTPKKMTAQGPVADSNLFLSGHSSQMPAPALPPAQLAQHLAATNDETAWIGPWGNSYSANLTPDSTGILAWNEQQFITCIKKGLLKGIEGSRPLMPPMPVDSYRNFTNDEVKAMFAYLKTIKPVHNVVPAYQPPTGDSH